MDLIFLYIAKLLRGQNKQARSGARCSSKQLICSLNSFFLFKIEIMENIFKLENFFVDSDFYGTVADFTEYLDLPNSEYAKNELEDEVSYECFTSTREPILNYTKDKLFRHIGTEIIGALYDRNEDRYPEEPEDIERKILKAFKESFDIEKFNLLLPKMFYANGKKVTITKANIVEYLED